MKQKFKLMLGDNIESLKKIPDNSIDSVVTDPPYGLSFMNKKWDYDVPSVQFWKEVYRVLKPGGHIVSFGGTRTYHRMVVNIEDAGFEIRDQIMWLYGSGFPKSLNVGKAIDKNQGKEIPKNKIRVVNSVGIDNYDGTGLGRRYDSVEYNVQNEYEGWGTALKPANEPICLARKPLSEKSVAENVLKWKTGGINVDGCRVETTDNLTRDCLGLASADNEGWYRPCHDKAIKQVFGSTEGRFPANVILECSCTLEDKSSSSICDNREGSESHTNPYCPCRLLDEQSGTLKSGKYQPHHKRGKTLGEYQGSCYGKYNNQDEMLNPDKTYGDSGGASRFFYQAKVSKAERNMGLDGFEEKETQQKGHGLDRVCMNEGCGASMLKPELCKCESPDWRPRPKKNSHPCVKPINLMTYLCRLITPENGIVLDPFMGSGSTGIAAQLEGFRFVGMEMDEEYMKIATARIENYEKYKKFIK